MAGPKSLCQYHSDDGSTYKISMPAWEVLTQTCTAPTTQPALPRGWARRRRYLRYNDSGKEQSITVLDPANALWTDAAGTGVAAPEPPDFGTTPGSPNSTLQGAIGEKRRTRI